MKVISKISKSGCAERANEDYIWHNDRCALVLDGSTPLLKGGIPAHVFVRDFTTVFSSFIQELEDLREAVNASIRALQAKYQVENSAGSVFPSAAGAFAYEIGEKIQILCIGDCTAVITLKNGMKTVVHLDEVDRFDRAVIDHMIQIRAETGGNIADIVKTDAIQEMLLANRKMMNRKGGYRIISLDSEPLAADIITEFDRIAVDTVTLYSDGFSLVEERILAGDSDFEALYRSLREMEAEDPYLNAHPRFKQADDASIISLRVV